MTITRTKIGRSTMKFQKYGFNIKITKMKDAINITGIHNLWNKEIIMTGTPNKNLNKRFILKLSYNRLFPDETEKYEKLLDDFNDLAKYLNKNIKNLIKKLDGEEETDND